VKEGESLTRRCCSRRQYLLVGHSDGKGVTEMGAVEVKQSWEDVVAQVKKRPQDRVARSAFRVMYLQHNRTRNDPKHPGAEQARLKILYAFQQLGEKLFDELTT
jgi:hypothetical protein